MFEAWNLREVLECLELGVDVTPLPLLYILTAGQLTQVNGFRRRIYTEEKAKVVAAAWGTKLIQLKKMMNSSYSSNRPVASS